MNHGHKLIFLVYFLFASLMIILEIQPLFGYKSSDDTIRPILIYFLILGFIFLTGIYFSRFHGRYWRLVHYFLKRSGWSFSEHRYAHYFRPPNLVHHLDFDREHGDEFVAHKWVTDEKIYFGYIQYFSKMLFWAKKPVLVYITTDLPGKVSGWARLFPVGDPVLSYVCDIDLESIRFNRYTYLEASPKKIGTYTWAPDLMDWYLDQVHKPWIHVEDKKVCVASVARPGPIEIDRMIEQLLAIKKMLARSGALERSSQPNSEST